MNEKKRVRTFVVFAIFFAIIGFLFAILEMAFMEVEIVLEQIESYIGEIDMELNWLYLAALIFVSFFLLWFTYRKSLNPDLTNRPIKWLYILGLGVSFQIAAIVVGGASEIGVGEILAGTILIFGIPAALIGAEIGIGNAAYYFGKTEQDSDRLQRAKLLFSIAYTLLPSNIDVKEKYGLTLLYNHDEEKATEVIKKIIGEEEITPETYRIGVDLFERHNYFAEAEICYTKLRELYPKSTNYILKLADILVKQDKTEKALLLLERSMDSGSIQILSHLFSLYLRTQKTENAKETLERISELDRTPYNETFACFDAYLKEHPDDDELLAKQARLYEKSGEQEKANTVLEKIMQIAPDNVEARKHLVEIYQKQALFDKMEPHLQFLAESGEASADMLYDFGEMLYQKRDLKAAKRQFQKGTSLYFEDYRFCYYLAVIALDEEDIDEAETRIGRAIKKAPPKNHALLESFKNRVKEARMRADLKKLEKEVQEHPTDGALLFDFVELLCACHQGERAISELDLLLTRKPEMKNEIMTKLSRLIEESDKNFVLMDFYATLNLKEGNYDEVLNLYKTMSTRSIKPDAVLEEGCERIFSYNAHHIPSIITMGNISFDKQDWHKATNFYESALRLNPEHFQEIGSNLYHTLRMTNKHEKAQECGEKLLERNPDDIDHAKDFIMVLRELKSFDSALKILEDIRQKTPTDRDIGKLIKETDIEKKRARIKELNELLSDANNQNTRHDELGDLHFFFEEYNEAIQHYQKSARDEKIALLAKVKIGLCLARKSLMQLAHETLSEINFANAAEEDHDILKELLYHIALLFEESGMKERALDLYKKVFKIDAGYKKVVEKIEKFGG